MATQNGQKRRPRAGDGYVAALRRIFDAAGDKRAAHRRSRAVLADMAGDRAFLTEALAAHLRAPDALDRLHYPVLSLAVESNPDFDLVANCWIPLPDGRADVSTKAIHHHGRLLLTTVTAFGPGYDHWTFAVEPLDPEDRRWRLELIEREAHPLGHLAFVDSYVAHVPLYPPSLTVTLALWSHDRATGWRDRLKRVPALQRHAARLRRAGARAGLEGALDLKVPAFFDFHPVAGGFAGLAERTEFPRGPNEDYLRSLFHVLQRTGNQALGDCVRDRLDDRERVADPALVRSLLADLDAGNPVDGRLSPGHHGVAHANFSADDIRRALAAQGPGGGT